MIVGQKTKNKAPTNIVKNKLTDWIVINNLYELVWILCYCRYNLINFFDGLRMLIIVVLFGYIFQIYVNKTGITSFFLGGKLFEDNSGYGEDEGNNVMGVIDSVEMLLLGCLVHFKRWLVFAFEWGKVNSLSSLDDVAIINTLPVHDDLKRQYKIK